MKRIVLGVLFVVVASADSPIAAGAEVSKAVADSWPAKWCEAQPGSTKEALVAIMGPPTSSSPKSLSWYARQYQFNAFLDADGKVRQLDINEYKLSAAEKAALKCKSVRSRASMEQEAEAAKATRSGPTPRACALVTEKEMSAILGAPVVGAANDSNSQTECIYKPADASFPYVELSVDWGGGEAAMAATGMMQKQEPGIADPYAGIGDQAAAVGPSLWIRTGDDLMTIVFAGVSDGPAAAKRIFDTAKPRM